MSIYFIAIFIISFITALLSMKDFSLPSEIKRFIEIKKIRGTIVFLKNKIKHYSSFSSVTSSPD